MIHRYTIEVDSKDNVTSKQLKQGIINHLNVLSHHVNSIIVNDYNKEGYIALPWPEYQDYMAKDWFREESYYDSNKDTYLIPKNRYDGCI